MRIESKLVDRNQLYPDVMTAQQVANYLQMTRKTIQNWASEGKIPHKKINGTIRYIKSDIEKWLK